MFNRDEPYIVIGAVGGGMLAIVSLAVCGMRFRNADRRKKNIGRNKILER